MSSHPHSASSGWRRQFFQSPLDWLLLSVPLAFALRYLPAWHNESFLFIVSCIGVVPLAGWLGRATEQLSERAGAGIGGLLNATFGNAAELIIALAALSKGLTDVVKASLTGSILGNLLLVLGGSILAGGFKFDRQIFNKTATRSSITTMSLAAAALIIPTLFHFAASKHPTGWSPALGQRLSLGISIVLFATYALSLVFSLVTHRQLFGGGEAADSHHGERPPLKPAIVLLLISTVLIAFLSEFLVGALEVARESLGLTETFVGIIVVALVGNAAEHSSAIFAALKNKMDLSLNIAVGSSTQIALFVAPVLVFASYAFGKPMDMEFTLPEVACVALAVWIVALVAGDGESNWFEGVQLLAVYLIMAILFFFLPDMSQASAIPLIPAIPAVP